MLMYVLSNTSAVLILEKEWWIPRRWIQTKRSEKITVEWLDKESTFSRCTCAVIRAKRVNVQTDMAHESLIQNSLHLIEKSMLFLDHQ